MINTEPHIDDVGEQPTTDINQADIYKAEIDKSEMKHWYKHNR